MVSQRDLFQGIVRIHADICKSLMYQSKTITEIFNASIENKAIIVKKNLSTAAVECHNIDHDVT